MAFSHLTFQEYLASSAFVIMMSLRGEPKVSRVLLEHYEKDPERWEEVVLLYAAQLTGRQQHQFLGRLRPYDVVEKALT
jgi:hypothetical protein